MATLDDAAFGAASEVMPKFVSPSAVPIVLFLRAIFIGQSKKRSQAVSDFKKQMNYLIWVTLFVIACGVVYSLGKLIYQFLI
jgi:hypothetical protein